MGAHMVLCGKASAEGCYKGPYHEDVAVEVAGGVAGQARLGVQPIAVLHNAPNPTLVTDNTLTTYFSSGLWSNARQRRLSLRSTDGLNKGCSCSLGAPPNLPPKTLPVR
jgi:hypothetical protein